MNLIFCSIFGHCSNIHTMQTSECKSQLNPLYRLWHRVILRCNAVGVKKRARPLNILTSPTSKRARRPQFAGWFKVQQIKQKSPLKSAACDSRCFLSSRALILTFVTWKSGGQDPKWRRALSRALPCVTCHPTASPLHSCVRAHTQVTLDHGPSFVFFYF